MIEKIEIFKALMTSAGTRGVSYKGYEYYRYLTSGMQIKTSREEIAEVTLTLNVTDKMKS